MLDMLIGIIILSLSGVLIVCFFSLIEGIMFRWIGVSANNEKIYRTRQRSLDYLFDGISLTPTLIISCFWSVYFVVPLITTLTGYTTSFTQIGAIAIMWIVLILFTFKIRQIRHKMLKEDIFSKTRKDD